MVTNCLSHGKAFKDQNFKYYIKNIKFPDQICGPTTFPFNMYRGSFPLGRVARE
jgi:hypothetical protein